MLVVCMQLTAELAEQSGCMASQRLQAHEA